FKQETDPNLFKTILSTLETSLGKERVNNVLEAFVREFPPSQMIEKEFTEQDYLDLISNGILNREIVFQEMFHNWLQNSNPSLNEYRELFTDENLKKNEDYLTIIQQIQQEIDTKTFVETEKQSLFEFIQNPIKKAPHSLKEQIEFIITKWTPLLDSSYHYRLLYALDLFNEEEKLRLLGAGPTEVYEYDYLEERYTPDKDWMPSVIMIAKNIYVWLFQLSAKYQREVTRLDQIPEEELEQLALWGFNCVWLIGLWERSPASKTVKQWCGNPEAEASAYSLYDYVISADLGGEEAFQKLKTKATAKGIRLAADMVPNHTGIYSKWIREHPEWFISSDVPPFPSYSYSGDNLSHDSNIGIYLEDHYFSRTDAAVTFKRVDFRTGETKYIYHGNDGTSMPWNDTAQLNYLLPEVREAVIQSILHVARNFPIIRFDAAMTLTRKHFQRLWFPLPGSGGDIPSRAESGLTQEKFQQLMPQEFWREVVDKINEEIPDTLLLAEAFWLLEGFFVRALGMHRVYNSAFQNMLRDEENANYRSVIKNTMEYDPQILKRFVNFLSNPDEEAAVKQFGKGDKYFGVCLLLATMPGLPLFSHGMIEGYEEKYGMEYRRPYWNENTDYGLLQHHERIIFPLLKRRYMFSDVVYFYMYDLWTQEGFVDEDVFCFSNGTDTDRSLIVYHNKFKNTAGWIKNSISFLEKSTGKLINKSLIDGLSLKADEGSFLIFKDQITNLEYIRNVQEIKEKGLHVILEPYQSLALINLQEVQELADNQYSLLEDFLGGQGVPNIEEARQKLIFETLYRSINELLNKEFVTRIIELLHSEQPSTIIPLFDVQKLDEFGNQVVSYLEKDFKLVKNQKPFVEGINKNYEIFIKLRSDNNFANQLSIKEKEIMSYILPQSVEEIFLVLYWISFHWIGELIQDKNSWIISRSLFDEWFVGKEFNRQFVSYFPQESQLHSEERIQLLRLLISNQNRFISIEKDSASSLLHSLLKNTEIQIFLKFNRFEDILWFNSERLSLLIRFISSATLLKVGTNLSPEEFSIYLKKFLAIIDFWKEGIDNSEYQVEKLLTFVSSKHVM
ncbi:MAG: alpha-amylase family glycosyl hydrolase, partial [Candidatus Hodarchaeales archaeon]